MAESAPTLTTWKIGRSPTKKRNIAEFIKVYNRIQRELFFLNEEWLASSPTKKNSGVEQASAPPRELFVNEGEDASLTPAASMHEEDAVSYSSSNLFELDFTRRTNLVTEDSDDDEEEKEHEDDPILEFDLRGNSRWKHHMMGCKALGTKLTLN